MSTVSLLWQLKPAVIVHCTVQNEERGRFFIIVLKITCVLILRILFYSNHNKMLGNNNVEQNYRSETNTKINRKLRRKQSRDKD